MRNLIAISLLVLLVPASSAGPLKPEFSLSINLVEAEHSRDSNSSTTTIQVAGKVVDYSRSYGGHGASRRRPVQKRRTIKQADVESLERLIKEKGLLSSETIEPPSDQNEGSRRSVELEVRINLSGTEYTIKATGSPEKLQQEPIYQNLRELIGRIEALLGEG